MLSRKKKTVSLCDRTVGKSDLIAIAARMRATPNGRMYNQPVTTFRVEGCNLGKNRGMVTNELIGQCPSTTDLSIIECNFRNRGLRRLCGLFGKSEFSNSLPALRVLNVSANLITLDGARLLAQTLAVNHSIKELILDDNPVLDAGAKMFADCLQTNTVLEELSLMGCGLTDRATAMFARVLDPDATRHVGMCAALMCHEKTQTVVENGQYMQKAYCKKHTPAGAPQASEVLPLYNNTLKKLKLSGNDGIAPDLLENLRRVLVDRHMKK